MPALDLEAAALEPLVRRPGAATGVLDEAGDLRVIVKWPDPEALVVSVFDAADTHGLEGQAR